VHVVDVINGVIL